MCRDTTANKTIKGFYFEVLCAAYEVLNLQENEKLGCEVNNSDFIIEKENRPNCSVEVKNYKNAIGWGDKEFKNSMRNFIDMEKKYPNRYTFEFLTNTNMKHSSSNLLLWEKVKSGDDTEIDRLIREIKILYINQVFGLSVDEVVDQFDTYECSNPIMIDFRSFINRVDFKFGQNRSKAVLREKIINVVDSILGPGSSTSDDIDSVMYCLIDRVWHSAISDESDANKYLFKSDIETIITDRNTILNTIINDNVRNRIFEDFRYSDEYFEYINNALDCEIIFNDNTDLKEKFLCQFYSIFKQMLSKYTKQQMVDFIKSIKCHWFNRIDNSIVNDDLNILIIALVIISLPVDKNIDYIDLNAEKVIKNIGLDKYKFGIFNLEPSGLPEKVKLLKFIKQKFIESIPMDIESFSKGDTIVLENLPRGYLCPNCEEYDPENITRLIDGIVVDIADPTDFINRSLNNFDCNYHCGDCCRLHSDGLVEHQNRVRRLLNDI